MAKRNPPPPGPPSSGDGTPPTRSWQVRLDDDNGRRASICAAYLLMTLPEFVNARLREVLAEEYPRIAEAIGLGQ